MFCKKCGEEIDRTAAVCPKCGASQKTDVTEDKGGFAWGTLGCCLPVVGLILFLVWKDTKPKNAKAAGIGAIVSVVVCVVYYTIMIIMGVAAGYF